MAGLTPKSPSNLFPMHVPDSLLLGEKLKQLISYTFPLDCSLIALGLLMVSLSSLPTLLKDNLQELSNVIFAHYAHQRCFSKRETIPENLPSLGPRGPLEEPPIPGRPPAIKI